MNTLVVIFVGAFAASALVHLINNGSEARRREAREVSSNIIIGAWVLALAQFVSLAKLSQ
jgi:hypothetical protein